MSSSSHSQHLALEAGTRLPKRSRWVAHGARSMRSGVLPLFVAFSAVLSASTALVYRAQWCQLQAYAVALLVAIAVALHVHAGAIERLVGARLSWRAFCAACGARDTLGVQPGAFNERGVSLFETLYPWPTPLRTAVLLPASWAAWLAYGALFHEGVHVTRDEKIAEMWFGGDSVGWLRTVRTVLLFVMATQHIFSGDQRRDSVTAMRASLMHSFVFLVLCLFPDATATPQSLSFVLLVERAMLCTAALLLTERLERVRLLACVMRSYDVAHTWCMAILCMARGEQPPAKIGRGSRRELESCTDSLDASDHADDDLQQYRRELLRNAVDARLALVGGWPLLVSVHDARLWTSVQLALTALVLAFHWRRVHALLYTKSDLFCADASAVSAAVHRGSARGNIPAAPSHVDSLQRPRSPPPKPTPERPPSSRTSSPTTTETTAVNADQPVRRRSSSRRRRRVRAEPPVPAPTAADSSEMTEESDESTSDDSHERATETDEKPASSRPRLRSRPLPPVSAKQVAAPRRAATPTPLVKARRSPPTSEDENGSQLQAKRRSHSPPSPAVPLHTSAALASTLIPNKRLAVSTSKHFD